VLKDKVVQFGIPRGVIAPNLTPFNHDLSVATDLYVEHAKNLLASGCAALAPFGTTGEASSLSVVERMELLEALVQAGIAPGRLIPGTGLTNLPETLRLISHAAELGCRFVLVLPPFYFKGVSDDGLREYFSRLIDQLRGIEIGIFLYHIPKVAGVGLSLPVVKSLREKNPGHLIGIKDSSGDWENTRALLEMKSLIVYPGSELDLPAALSLGAPGCISATANINAQMISDVIGHAASGQSEAALNLHAAAKKIRLLIQDYPVISAQKSLLAAAGDRRWLNVRPPLVTMNWEKASELALTLDQNCNFRVKAP
jgi:4-hydroxy-tetrahydrodipicolinate synthase